MADRLRSLREVRLYAAGSDRQLRQDGFGHHFDFKALRDAQQDWINHFDPSAVNVYREEQTIYGRMLANLYEVATSFSWERAAEEYEKIYAWND